MRRLHAQPAATGILFSLLAGIVTARQCYYPNGAKSNDVACSDAENVHCCSSSSICLTNGYCLQQSPWPLGIARGSCTDSDWGSSCPQNCIDVRTTVHSHSYSHSTLLLQIPPRSFIPSKVLTPYSPSITTSAAERASSTLS